MVRVLEDLRQDEPGPAAWHDPEGLPLREGGGRVDLDAIDGVNTEPSLDLLLLREVVLDRELEIT